MAMRRQPDMHPTEYGGDDDLSTLIASFDSKEPQPDSKGGPFAGTPYKDATADEDAHMIGPHPDESGPYGNTTSGREMFDRHENTGLPHGMTVQSEEGYGGDGGQESFGAPMQGFSPNPVSGQRPNPAITQRVSSGGAPSALFSDASGGTPMFGRSGGLMGGGKGVLGMDEGGPSPTQMMLKLVRMFQSGGM